MSENTLLDKPIGTVISETKVLDDTIKEKSKILAEQLSRHPLNVELITLKGDLSKAKDDLLDYLTKSQIDSMNGNGYGKIAINESINPSGVDWIELHKDVIRKVFTGIGIDNINGVELEDFLKEIDVTALTMAFSLLKRDINTDTFRSLVKEDKKPPYVGTFVKKTLSLTK